MNNPLSKMSNKRPTEASWESDEDLLGDGSSVSAFSSKMQGDVTIEDIDEDALLMEEEEKSNNFSFQSQDEIIERVDLGISSENCAFDDTANSQELDYDDEGEEAPALEIYDETEEMEDPLFVGEQPNNTTCTAQPIQEGHDDNDAVGNDDGDDDNDDDDEDEGNTKKERGRFQTERKTISLVSTHTKSSDIPDSLEITKEMQEEIDSFEKQKGHGKFHNKGHRGGLQTRGQRQQGQFQQQQQQKQQQQRFQAPMNRGGPRQRGPNFGNRSTMFQGVRNANANTMRPTGSNNMMRPQGPQQGQFQQGLFQRGQFQQGFNPRPNGPNSGMNNGRPRFPHELMQQRGPRSSQAGHGLQMPQPLLSSTPQNSQAYQESPQFIQPVGEQVQFHQPQLSQPQPLIPLTQTSSGANIHVNPNFHGSLPPDIHSQHLSQSAPQPLFSQAQPIQNFQAGNQTWMGQTQHSSPAQVNYTTSPHPSHFQSQQQQPHQHQMIPSGQRPGILGSPPQGLMQQRPHHQRNTQPQPHNVSQGQPRQIFNNQHFQPRPQNPNNRLVTQRLGPQQSNVRPVTQRLGQIPSLTRGLQTTGQQSRQPRPIANQNTRGPRPANQNRGQLTQMRPRGPAPGIRNAQMGQPCFQAPQVSSTQSKGFNPKPVNLVNPVKKEPEIDPEKAKKIQELEEKKRLRAERFKDNVPVEANLVKKKVVLNRAQKRPSGDPPKESEEVSPAKTLKIERLGSNVTVKEENKTETEEEMDDDTALKKALEEQKRRRELILKAKEAKRLLLASKRRQNLVVKLAQEGKTLADVKSQNSGNESSGMNENNPSQKQHFQGHQMSGKGQQYNQSHQVHVQGHEDHGYIHNQQQGVQQKQFQTSINKRGMNRGQMSNRGQMTNRGQMSNRGNVTNRGNMSNRGQNVNRVHNIRPQGQPISVLGQGQQKMASQQVGRCHGNVRGQGHNRGKGRGAPKQSNIVQLQQVELHENIDYESYGTESSGNRTVLPLSSGSRQVVGMNSMGAASQGTPERKVMEKKEVFSPQRRIVLDSKQSSSVLIKDLPPKVDLGKISKRCSEYGKTKVFNYKAEEKSIVVQFSSPSEAAAFLNKSFRFMVDMNYCTAVAIPDNYV